jgi:hypothetical protein
MCGLTQHADLMARLGKYRNGVSCLYVKTLDDIHLPALKKLIRESIKQGTADSRRLDG